MNFSELLSRRGVAYRRNTNDPSWFHVNCMFCPERGFEPDAKFRLGINVQTGAARCFKCNWSSRRGPWLVLRRLQVSTEDFDNKEEPVEKKEIVVSLPRDFQVLNKCYDQMDQTARDYVLARGIHPRQIEVHRIGVSYIGRYAYRVLFPIYVSKHLKGITARDFTGRREPRYLNSPGDKYLYNFKPQKKWAVFCEGPIKALRLERAVGSGVALQGHALTEQQLQQVIDSQCEHITIWPDPNLVGRQGAIRVAERLLSDWHGRVSMVWPAPTPPDDCDISELRERLQHPLEYDWSVRQKLTLDF